MGNQKLWLFFLLIPLLASCKAQIATKIMKENLHVIEMKVHHDSTLNFNEIEPAIIFLEQTTGIKSESNMNYIGRYQPTLNDFNKWSSWFRSNRKRLYWDDVEKKVRIRPSK